MKTKKEIKEMFMLTLKLFRETKHEDKELLHYLLGKLNTLVWLYPELEKLIE